MSSSVQREGAAVAECSLLRTQLPATFMTRSSMSLTAEFLRWKHQVDVSYRRNEPQLEMNFQIRQITVLLTYFISRCRCRYFRAVIFKLSSGSREIFHLNSPCVSGQGAISLQSDGERGVSLTHEPEVVYFPDRSRCMVCMNCMRIYSCLHT